jgi:hypothetical protein
VELAASDRRKEGRILVTSECDVVGILDGCELETLEGDSLGREIGDKEG